MRLLWSLVLLKFVLILGFIETFFFFEFLLVPDLAWLCNGIHHLLVVISAHVAEVLEGNLIWYVFYIFQGVEEHDSFSTLQHKLTVSWSPFLKVGDVFIIEVEPLLLFCSGMKTLCVTVVMAKI